MVRCFQDDNVVHVAGKIDPLSDIEVINTELALADMASVEKALLRSSKIARTGNKDEQTKKLVLESRETTGSGRPGTHFRFGRR